MWQGTYKRGYFRETWKEISERRKLRNLEKRFPWQCAVNRNRICRWEILLSRCQRGRLKRGHDRCPTLTRSCYLPFRFLLSTVSSSSSFNLRFRLAQYGVLSVMSLPLSLTFVSLFLVFSCLLFALSNNLHIFFWLPFFSVKYFQLFPFTLFSFWSSFFPCF